MKSNQIESKWINSGLCESKSESESGDQCRYQALPVLHVPNTQDKTCKYDS